MALGFSNILDKVVSYALASGLFEKVNQHEPKNSPGLGLTAAVWIDTIVPISSSGLSSTSGRVVLKIRIYVNMLKEPQDAIDPEAINAVDVLFAAYSGDFDLGSTVKNVDLLGAYGVALSAQAGYLEMDGKMFRIIDITLPVIINDIWGQSG